MKSNITIAEIHAARPDLGFEILSGDTPLIREDGGYSVSMRGYYSAAELRAILADLESANQAFADKL
ncbi:hypothetical protein VSR68_30550 [Paraburkholderia phymatum]|uniref:hypothetical protein n=1 Tax=Paraburkholderia phymatum TaxID=148447 RepID=UPI00316DAC38